ISVTGIPIIRADYEVTVTIVVEVPRRHRHGQRTGYPGGRLEGAIAVAQPDVHAPGRGAVVEIDRHRRGQVQMAVVVEVGDREGRALEAVVGAGGVDGGAEATPTVAEQHADSVEAGAGRGQVESAVVVEVGCRYRPGNRADGEARDGAEAGREAVF